MYAIYNVKGKYYLSGKNSYVKIYKTKEYALKRLEWFNDNNLFIVKISLIIDDFINEKEEEGDFS